MIDLAKSMIFYRSIRQLSTPFLINPEGRNCRKSRNPFITWKYISDL